MIDRSQRGAPLPRRSAQSLLTLVSASVVLGLLLSAMGVGLPGSANSSPDATGAPLASAGTLTPTATAAAASLSSATSTTRSVPTSTATAITAVTNTPTATMASTVTATATSTPTTSTAIVTGVATATPTATTSSAPMPTLIAPGTYGFASPNCPSGPTSDTLRFTHISASQTLRGQIFVRYVLGGGATQPVPGNPNPILVQVDGSTLVGGTYSVTLTYPPASQWPVVSAGTSEIHVDIQVEVYSGGVLQGTLGPGQNFDVYCMGKAIATSTSTPTTTNAATPTATATAAVTGTPTLTPMATGTPTPTAGSTASPTATTPPVTATPSPTPVLGVALGHWDVNGDGSVNVTDIEAVGQHWMESVPPCSIAADVNCDGSVNLLDIEEIGAHWQEIGTPRATSGLALRALALAATDTPGTTPAPTLERPTRTSTPTPISVQSSLSFAPGPISASVGSTVSLSVVMGSSAATGGFQFGLSFDPTVIIVESVQATSLYSDWANNFGGFALPVGSWSANNSTGSVSVSGVALIGCCNPPPAVGSGTPTPTPVPLGPSSGTVATVTLQVVGTGSSALAFVPHQSNGNGSTLTVWDGVGNFVAIGPTLGVASITGVGPGTPTATPGTVATGTSTVGTGATATTSATATLTASATITATATDGPSPTPRSTVTVVPTATLVPVGSLTLAPPATAPGVGSTFTVNVNMVVLSGLVARGAQFGLKFDPTLLQAKKVTAGPFFQDWASRHSEIVLTAPPFTIDNTAGTIAIGGLALFGGGADGPTGSGSGALATIQFQALAQGTATLTLHGASGVALQPGQVTAVPGGLSSTDLQLTIGAAVPTVAPTATVTATQAATVSPPATATQPPTATSTVVATVTPTPTISITATPSGTVSSTLIPTLGVPTLAATPTLGASTASLSFSPVPLVMSVGDTATVTVVISADQQVQTAEFGLSFDKTIVSIVGDVQEGPYFSGWASAHNATSLVVGQWTVDNSLGTVAVAGISLLGATSGPTGSGTLATFQVKALANGSATLTFEPCGDKHNGSCISGVASGGAVLPGATLNTGTVQVGVVGTPGTTTPTPGPGTPAAIALAGTPGAVGVGTPGPGGLAARLANGASPAGAANSAGQSPVGGAAGGSAGVGGPGSVPGGNPGAAGEPGGVSAGGAAIASRAGTGTTGGNLQAGTSAGGFGRPGVAGGVGAPGPLAGGAAGDGSATSAAGGVLVPGAAGQGPGGLAGGGLAGAVGGVGVSAPIASIDLTGKVDDRGMLSGDVQYSEPSGLFSIAISAGTVLLNKDGTPLKVIEARLSAEHPVVPDDQALVGVPIEFGPSGARFEPPIRLSVAYDRSQLPPGSRDDDLVLALYDSSGGSWAPQEGIIVDPAAQRASGLVHHFTSFGVLTKPPASVNWLLVALILSVELGLGAAAYLYIIRRPRATAWAEDGADLMDIDDERWVGSPAEAARVAADESAATVEIRRVAALPAPGSGDPWPYVRQPSGAARPGADNEFPTAP